MEKLNEVCIEERKNTGGYFKEFLVCPSGKIISEKKKSAFVCPNCGNPLCLKEELKIFDDDYCTECGHKITSAKEEAMALVNEEN